QWLFGERVERTGPLAEIRGDGEDASVDAELGFAVKEWAVAQRIEDDLLRLKPHPDERGFPDVAFFTPRASPCPFGCLTPKKRAPTSRFPQSSPKPSSP